MNLNAIDTDELKIISTILQDGLIEVNDIKYLPSIRSFFLMITRFMWEEKIVNKVDQRIKAVLSFEDVLSVYSKNIEIELLFKNDAIIKLETEIIRCKLEDQGEPWNIEKIENDKNN